MIGARVGHLYITIGPGCLGYEEEVGEEVGGGVGGGDGD